MFRKELILGAVVVLAFWVCDLQAAQIASTWVGGPQGEWGQASNWNPAIVPDNGGGNTFAVTINAGAGKVNVGLRQWRTIDQLDSYGEVELDEWPHDWQKEPVELSLVDPNGLTNYGHLNIEELRINGNITNTTGAKIVLLDSVVKGDIYNPAGGIIQFEFYCWVGGAVENAGSMIIVPSCFLHVAGNTFHNTGQVQLIGGACVVQKPFHNDSTGVVMGVGGFLRSWTSIQNDGQIWAQGVSLGVIPKGPIINTGTLANKPSSTLYLQPPVDVNNTGTIESNLKGAVVFDCNLVNEPNGVIRLRDGTLAATTITQSAGATFEGFGGITGDVVIDPNGLIRLTGPTNVVGDVEIGKNATLEISDGTTLITGHIICNGTIHLKGGRVIPQRGWIIPQGGMSGNCNIIWEPGTYTNIADFNLDGTVNFKDLAYLADTWLWQTGWI